MLLLLMFLKRVNVYQKIYALFIHVIEILNEIIYPDTHIHI